MFSRMFVRTVLVSVIAAMIWALFWTWTMAGFQDLVPKVFFTIIEGGFLLASLSLLIESFLSFESFDVKKESWAYTLFGYWLMDLDEETTKRLPSINVRTCVMFGARSFILSLIFLLTVMVLAIFFQATKGVVSFLADPYMPSIPWLNVDKFIGVVVSGLVGGTLVIEIIEWSNKKLANVATAVKVLIWTLALSILFSLMMSIINIFSPIDDSPFYVIFLTAMAVCLLFAAFVESVIGLGLGIYKLAGYAVLKFPVLENVWNQICPVRKINFLEN